MLAIERLVGFMVTAAVGDHYTTISQVAGNGGVINCHVNSVNVTTSDGNYEFPERQMVGITRDGTTMSAGSPS